MKFKWTPRKILTAASFGALLLFVGLSFCPWYSIRLLEADGSTISSIVYGTIIQGFYVEHDPKNIARIIIYSIDLALAIVSAIYLIISFRQPYDSTDDKEDKYYVYGMFFFIATCALKGMGDFGFNYTIMMLISLFFALLGILGVVIHYKKVTEY